MKDKATQVWAYASVPCIATALWSFHFCPPTAVALGCCSTRMPEVVDFLCNSVGGKPAGTRFVLLQVNPVLPIPSYATSVITLRQDIFLFH